LFEHPPSSIKVGAHLRIYYATQPQVNPPVFLFFANDAKMIHWGYARYLENRLREKFGYVGTPIKIVFRGRPERDPDEVKPTKRRQPAPKPSIVAVPLDEQPFIETWDSDDFDDRGRGFLGQRIISDFLTNTNYNPVVAQSATAGFGLRLGVVHHKLRVACHHRR
jgi:hypothetical protein